MQPVVCRCFRDSRANSSQAWWGALSICLILFAASTADAREPVAALLRIDLPPATAQLVSLGNEQASFRVEGRSIDVAWNECVVWGAPGSNDLAPQLVTRAGDLIIGDLAGISAETVEVESTTLGKVTISRAHTAGMVLRPPVDRLDRDRLWRTIRDQQLGEDLVRLFNGDELVGDVRAKPESGEAFAAALRVGDSQTAADLSGVEVIQLAGIAPRAPEPAPEPRLWLGFHDGTRLAVREIRTEPDRVELTLMDGSVVAAGREELTREICWLQPLTRSVAYLSRLPAAGYRHLAYFGVSRPLQRDRNVLGGSLRMAGQEYALGLGMPSASRVTYELADGYRILEVDVGIDDAAERRGAVVFRIFLDRGSNEQPGDWELAWESPIVRGGDPVLAHRVAISRARRVALVVDYAERAHACDYANWGNVRLVR